MGDLIYILIFILFAQFAVADTTVDLRTQYRKSICGFSVDLDFTPQQQLILDQDLIFLLSLQGKKSSILHEMFFGTSKVSGVAYCDFLAKKIRGLNYGSRLEKAQVGFNYGYSGDIVLGDFFFELSRIERLGTLIHEARHTEALETAHVVCNQNIFSQTGLNLRDKPACDVKTDGAYGYEFIWYRSIYNDCQNCDSNTKHTAFDSAELTLQRIIPKQ